MLVKEMTFLGIPVAKGRPRLTNWGGIARAYTPAKTKSAEADVRHQAEVQWGSEPPLGGPVKVSVTFWMPRPKSYPKKASWDYHVKKPDFDNLAKLLCDSLNGLCWTDDSQICRATISKRYGPAPKTELRIEELELGLTCELA